MCVRSYRRFNHFDELSGRFWLRSWAGSADSLDNPAFTRSDELLHLQALDRPCCYHDDTLSLASTCPSHGTHLNTIYPIRYTQLCKQTTIKGQDGFKPSAVCCYEPTKSTPNVLHFKMLLKSPAMLGSIAKIKQKFKKILYSGLWSIYTLKPLSFCIPRSSQYGWRGSEMSMGDGVLDSGKASDLSVCSWPVEPIHWTPFPLLQQLASHRTPTVSVSLCMQC